MDLNYILNKQPMDCDPQLAATCIFMPTFWWAILARKVGHIDLVSDK